MCTLRATTRRSGDYQATSAPPFATKVQYLYMWVYPKEKKVILHREFSCLVVFPKLLRRLTTVVRPDQSSLLPGPFSGTLASSTFRAANEHVPGLRNLHL